MAKKRTRTGGRRTKAARSRKRKGATRKPSARVARKRNAARASAARSTGSAARKRAPKPSAASKAAATVKGALKGAIAAVTKRLPTSQLDAITLLEQDHRQLEDLLARGVESGGKARKALLDRIAAELTVHETIEEQVLYPALKEYPEARGIVLEGFQEHHVADLIMKELYDTSVADEQWGAKFKVFKENIEHHIQEEEGPMFRTARGVMTHEQLVALGARMSRLKEAAARGRL